MTSKANEIKNSFVLFGVQFITAVLEIRALSSQQQLEYKPNQTKKKRFVLFGV